MTLTIILLCIGIFILSLLCNWIMIRYLRVMDVPNERSSHHISTPKSGGISIVVGFILLVCFINWYFPTSENLINFNTLSLAAIVVAIASLIDDIWDKTHHFKLYSQLLACFVVLYSGLYFNVADIFSLTVLSILISGFWIVGLTNAYNFMDGLDGIMGGTAVLGWGFLALFCNLSGDLLLTIIALSLMCACIAFLFFNFPPAKIFMGDVGSAFLGFMFAVFAIWAFNRDSLPMLVVPMLLFHIIFDTFITYLRRARNGEKLTQAHRTHCYQLLNQMGYSHKQVSLLHYSFVIWQALGAYIMLDKSLIIQLLLFVPLLIVQGFYASRVLKQSYQKKLLPVRINNATS